MTEERLWRSLKGLALSTCALLTSVAHSQVSDRTSCVEQPSPILLSDRVTLEADTHIFKVDQTSASTIGVQAYELDLQTGKAGRVLWQSQLDIRAQLNIEQGHGTPRNSAQFDAAFIGTPRPRSARDANDPSYTRFAEAGSERDPTLYVIARDGQLFGLNVRTGQSNQIATSKRDKNDGKSVGATLATSEALIQNEWRTLLVALTQSSQLALHGIDATDPNEPRSVWSQTVASNISLLQNTPTPVIAQSNHGWSVMFTASGALHIHDAATGALLRSLNVASKADALTDPLAVDMDRDGKIERAYVGDVKGNLWRFDLSSSDPKRWQVAFGGRPLLTVTDADGTSRQIIKRPEIALSRDARTPILLFAAKLNGSLALFGVHDRDRPIDATDFMGWQYPITGAPRTRESNANATRFTKRLGWRRDLRESTQISPPRVHDDRVVLISTHRPLDTTCPTPAASLLAFSIEDGEEQVHIPLFGDTGDTNEQPGAANQRAIADIPIILDHSTRSGSCLRHYYLGSKSNSLVQVSGRCPSNTFGRQSWRQLR